MPGINAKKTYITNENGEFIVPKEDLPEIQDINLRWGTVKEVTLAGKLPQESAKNTYVPNRVRMRMILRDNSNSLYDYQYLYFYIQRKVNPEDQWQNIPSYLPNSGSRNLDAYRVSDKNNPNSILPDKNYIQTKVIVQIMEDIITIFIPIGSFKKIPENSKTINLNIGMEVTFITL